MFIFHLSKRICPPPFSSCFRLENEKREHPLDTAVPFLAPGCTCTPHKQGPSAKGSQQQVSAIFCFHGIKTQFCQMQNSNSNRGSSIRSAQAPSVITAHLTVQRELNVFREKGKKISETDEKSGRKWCCNSTTLSRTVTTTALITAML